MSTIDSLSDDLLSHGVFSCLSPSELARSAEVCKRWDVTSREVWRVLKTKDLPIPYVNGSYVKKFGFPVEIDSLEKLQEFFRKFANQLRRDQTAQIHLFFPEQRAYMGIALGYGKMSLISNAGVEGWPNYQRLVKMNLPSTVLPHLNELPLLPGEEDEDEEITNPQAGYSENSSSSFPNSTRHHHLLLQAPLKVRGHINTIVDRYLTPIATHRLDEIHRLRVLDVENRLILWSSTILLGLAALSFSRRRG